MKKFRKIMAVLVAAMMIISSFTLTAFAEDNVIISYNGNDGASGSMDSTSGEGKATVAGNRFTKTGYYFTGWNSAQNGTGDVYQPGDKIETVGTTPLYAQWAKATSPSQQKVDNDNSKYTIWIKSGVNDQAYKAYKIFGVTLANSEGNTSQESGFAYTINSGSPFYDWINSNKATYGIKLTQVRDTNTYVVTFSMNQKQAQDFAAGLATQLAGKTEVGKIDKYVLDNDSCTVATADDYEGNAIDVTRGGLGYYLIDSSMGSLCALDTTNQDAIVFEKNSTPQLTKAVREDKTKIKIGELESTKNDTDRTTSASAVSDTFGSFASADIGQTVYFKLEAKTGSNTNFDAADLGNGVSSVYVIHDTLPAGMSYNGYLYGTADNAVTSENKKNGESLYVVSAVTDPNGTNQATWTLGTDYWVDYSDPELTITLANAAVKKLGQNATISIIYGATVDTDAVIGDGGNVNTANMTYTGDSIDYTTADVSATVYVEAAALLKFTTAGADLGGATFSMKTPEGTQMYFTPMNAGSDTAPAVYMFNTATVAAGSNNLLTAPESGAIVVYGLDAGTYTLTEEGAPAGYLPLTSTFELTVAHAATALTEDVKLKTSTNVEVLFEDGKDDTNASVTVNNGTTASNTINIAPTSVVGVENKTSTELPSTGGMGTTVLYIVGGMLVILAGAYLFFSRKKTA